MSIVIALLTVVTPISGVAVTADDRRRIVVGSGDLNLAVPSDVRRFNTRVHTAVEQVCAVSGRTIEELSWRQACREEAMASARQDIASAMIASRRNARIELGAR